MPLSQWFQNPIALNAALRPKFDGGSHNLKIFELSVIVPI